MALIDFVVTEAPDEKEAVRSLRIGEDGVDELERGRAAPLTIVQEQHHWASHAGDNSHEALEKETLGGEE